MEASRKTYDQEGGAAVRAIGDRLVIERLTIEDERTARLVRERAEAGQSPDRTVVDAVEIGARVLEREGLGAEVDYVRGEFERTATEVRDLFGERARGVTEALQKELERVFSQEGGVMARLLESHADELSEEIARSFGPDRATAVQHQIREMVAKSLEQSRADLVRHLSSEDGANPLADFKAAIVRSLTETTRTQQRLIESVGERLGAVQTELVRLTEQGAARRQLEAAEERGAAKGRSFEERVFAAVERIAGGRGDCARHVGDEQGEGGGKQGDVVVEIGAADAAALGRIVLEVKNERLSKNAAWQVLDEAMQQRSADLAVLVVAGEERIPAGREALHEYEGNKLIVAADPECPDDLSLEVAYRLARSRVLMARETDLTLDAAAVRDEAEEAITALKQAQRIRLALTGASKGIDKARKGLDEMTELVRSHLERIESLVE